MAEQTRSISCHQHILDTILSDNSVLCQQLSDIGMNQRLHVCLHICFPLEVQSMVVSEQQFTGDVWDDLVDWLNDHVVITQAGRQRSAATPRWTTYWSCHQLLWTRVISQPASIITIKIKTHLIVWTHTKIKCNLTVDVYSASALLAMQSAVLARGILSVRPSRSGIVSRWKKIQSCVFQHLVGQSL